MTPPDRSILAPAEYAVPGGVCIVRVVPDTPVVKLLKLRAEKLMQNPPSRMTFAIGFVFAMTSPVRSIPALLCSS